MWFLLALTSAIFYSSLWLFARKSRGLPSSVVTAASNFPGPIMLLLVAPRVEFPWGETWWQLYLVWPFLIMPLTFWTLTFVAQRIPVTVVNPLTALSSIAALFITTYFFGKSFSPLGIFGVIVVTMGLLTLYHDNRKIWKKPWPWVGVLCVLILGTHAAIVGAVLERFPHPVAISALIITGACIVPSISAGRKWLEVRWTRNIFLFLGAFALAILGQDLMTQFALVYGPAPYVVAVKRTSILLTSLGGYFLLKEKDQSLQRLLAASLLVILGILLLTIL